MSRSRKMGLAWGIQIGACLALGATFHPAMFLVAAFPMFGCWAFRGVE